MSERAPPIVPPLAAVDWVLAVSKAMGVSQSRAAAALEANSNDVEAACEAIIAGKYEEGADATAVPLTAQQKVAQLSTCLGVDLKVANAMNLVGVLTIMHQVAENALLAKNFNMTAAEEHLLLGVFGCGSHCAPVQELTVSLKFVCLYMLARRNAKMCTSLTSAGTVSGDFSTNWVLVCGSCACQVSSIPARANYYGAPFLPLS